MKSFLQTRHILLHQPELQSRFEEELTYLVLHRWLGITNTYK